VLFALWKHNYSVYGRRKLTKAAQRSGIDVGRDQVARLMAMLDLAGATRSKKRFTTKADPAQQPAAGPREAQLHRHSAERAVGGRLRVPRGAPEPCGDERTPPVARRSEPLKLRAA
jgi:transposase InsO family protein